MNIYKTLEWIREGKFTELPFNVHGALVGPKVKNGQATDQMCLVLLVKEKLPISTLSPEQIVPKFLDIESDLVLTDVQEIEILEALATVDCHTLSETVEPVKSNRIRYRPLVGGCSSINTNGSDATLGLIVRDRTDGQVVALSNSHVYAASQVSTAVSTAVNNNRGTINTLTLSGRQPGTNSFNGWGDVDPGIDYIGLCKRPVIIGNLDPTRDNNGWITTHLSMLQFCSYPVII